ncbi:unnamed protein product, partial [Nesidiocoris tenuis]
MNQNCERSGGEFQGFVEMDARHYFQNAIIKALIRKSDMLNYLKHSVDTRKVSRLSPEKLHIL